MASPGEPVLWSLYVYIPNREAPIFFTVAYGLSAVFHIWQCYHNKAWRLVWLHPACAVLFTLGYALREYSAMDNYLYSTTDKMPLIVFILSQVFIYVCPPLLELANYHVLARVFYYVPYYAPIAPGRVLGIFGGLMAVVEALNAIGVALTANTSSSAQTQSLGKNLTVAAISIQVAVIVVFVIAASAFHWRYSKAGFNAKEVSTVLYTLYASMALIFARCVFRLVEHSGNTHVDLNDMEVLRKLSPLLRYESFFYVFEATLMLLNSWLWNIWHPGRSLPRDYHVYLAQDGTEVIGERHGDDRPLLAKTAHVLTFGILFRDKKELGASGHRMEDLRQR